MNLGYESGDQVAAFDEKNRSKKSRASVPLSEVLGINYAKEKANSNSVKTYYSKNGF